MISMRMHEDRLSEFGRIFGRRCRRRARRLFPKAMDRIINAVRAYESEPTETRLTDCYLIAEKVEYAVFWTTNISSPNAIRLYRILVAGNDYAGVYITGRLTDLNCPRNAEVVITSWDGKDTYPHLSNEEWGVVFRFAELILTK